MRKQSTPSQLATPHDLSDKVRQEIAASLNPLVADAFVLYIKSKNFHWHISGSHFRDYHLLFDEQADQIFASIDQLAERTRKLGKMTIRSISHIASLQTIADNNEEFLTPEKMVKQLLEDNKCMAAQMRQAHQICQKYGDVASTSLLEILIDETERRVWFLFEISSS